MFPIYDDPPNDEPHTFYSILSSEYVSKLYELVDGLELDGGGIVSNTTFNDLIVNYTEPGESPIIHNESILTNGVLQGDWQMRYESEEILGVGKKHIIIAESYLLNVRVSIFLKVDNLGIDRLSGNLYTPAVFVDSPVWPGDVISDVSLESSDLEFDLGVVEKVTQIDDKINFLLNDICKVTFDSGICTFVIPVPPKYAFKGNLITEPTPFPQPREGYYYFNVWLDEFGSPFDFSSTPILEDITLYANWSITE